MSSATAPIKKIRVMIDMRDVVPARSRLTYFTPTQSSLEVTKLCRILEVKVNDFNATDIFPETIRVSFNFSNKPEHTRLNWFEKWRGMIESHWFNFGIHKDRSEPYLSARFLLGEQDLLKTFNTCIISGDEISGMLGRIHKAPLTLQQFAEGPYSLNGSIISFYNLLNDDEGGGPRKSKPTIDSIMASYEPHSMVLN